MLRQDLIPGPLREAGRISLRRLVTLLFLLVLWGCPPSHLLAKDDSAIESGGRERTYLVHLPQGYSAAKRWPIVFVLHGRGGLGAGMARLSHLNEFADRNGIIVVYPDGLDRSWADGRGTTPSDRAGVDDVAFISTLLDKMESTYSVDPSRVYATGLSNGGFMSFHLACGLATRIAAVAPVGAMLSVPLSQRCHPARPVAVLEINGTADPIVPYEGGVMTRGSLGTILSAHDSALAWARLDGCALEPADDTLPAKTSGGMVTRRALYSHCRGGSSVALYSVVGGGHTWPGGEQYLPAMFVGKTSRDLDANEIIWQFFQAHPLRD